MGGLQLLERLKSTGQNGFPSVLLIDPQDHDVTLAATAYLLGAESFLMRPIEKKEFCNLMSRFDAVTMDGCAGITIRTPSTTLAPAPPSLNPETPTHPDFQL